MASSILVRAEDRLKGATNFNVWKVQITNILQEHDLEQYVTIVVEEPMNNVGRVKKMPSKSSLTQSKIV
jgi:hypothetical protein